MKVWRKHMLALTSAAMSIALLTACAQQPSGSEPAAGARQAPYETAKVRLAVHANEGAALTAVAMENGCFEKYGIDMELVIVESGPSEMAAMRADNRSLDIGYIGPGVAWNPIDTTGNQVSFVFFDNLGNSEKLLAREGIFQDGNQDGKFDLDELYEGLKGQTVYLEVGTTPGTWLRNLIDAVNEGRNEEEKLWLQCDVESYLSGYTAPNSNEENKVVAVNYNNANIPAGMSSANAQRVDICGYAAGAVPMGGRYIHRFRQNGRAGKHVFDVL